MKDTWAPLYPICADLFQLVAILAFVMVALVIVGLIVTKPWTWTGAPPVPPVPKLKFPNYFYE